MVRGFSELDGAPNDLAVGAAIGKQHRLAVALRCEELTPAFACPAAHFEDVGKVAADRELTPVLDGRDEEVREREALHEYVIQQELAPDVHRVPGVPAAPA